MSNRTPDLCSKAEIRRFVRSKIQALTEETKLYEAISLRRQIDDLVKKQLTQSAAAKLFGFMALGHEPSWLAKESMEDWGLPICVPRVIGNKMEFVLVDSNTPWQTGPFRIHEPISNIIVTPSSNDLMIVPCLALTLDGHRLGHGKGYYDKYLAGLETLPQTVGVAFSTGIFPEITWSLEAHDFPLGKVLVP